MFQKFYVKDSDYYFDSYAHYAIHEEMIKDYSRTCAYKDAILQSKHLFKDKVLLDIGCGTGILSIFCAMAGAKHVYGIDNSGIAKHAKKICAENNFAEKITIIQGKVEEVELPVDKVDIIVSEWMGYFLFYESMLDCVIYARDKWLRHGGLLFPDKFILKMAGAEDGKLISNKLEFWDDVYGIDMSNMKQWV